MDGIDGENKGRLTPEQKKEVSEYGEIMNKFYLFKPEDRNRIIDGIHSLNVSADEGKNTDK